jgi:putative endonuclease
LRKTSFGGVDDGPREATPLRKRRAEKNPKQQRGGHYVYMVECSDGSLYTGYTTDPRRRLAQHNNGSASKYTRSRRPVKLVYLDELGARAVALRMELRLKKLKKEEKLLLCRAYSGGEKHGSR